METGKVILDATLRDGGLVNNHNFDDSFVKSLYEANIASGIDYMEFGYRADPSVFSRSEYGKWKFSTDEDIWNVVGQKQSRLKVSVMADVGRCNYKRDIADKSNSPVDLFRVATYIDQLQEAIQMIEYIYQRGYKVTCNIMAISKCDEKQRRAAVTMLKKLPLEAIYIVDSYGALYPSDIRNITLEYMESLADTEINVGIHAHNNQQLAFANTIESIQSGASWIDATAAGMGRGAGNCFMELLIGYLKNCNYDIVPILEFVNSKMDSLKKNDMVWGYNSYYMLTGLANVHPRSAISATRGYEKTIKSFLEEISY